MKNSMNHFNRPFNHAKILFLFALMMVAPEILAQSDCQVTGKIVEEKSNQPVPYATVVLLTNAADTTHFITGAITDANGSFTISRISSGKYKLKASSIGYKTVTKSLDILNAGVHNAGIFHLQDSIQLMDEIVVVGERPKGKTEDDRTIFFMNKKILAASGTATDLLRHIPGIQVDLKQNISLGGSRDILLFVNGKERDKSYISQLNPSLVDRVEIINTPPSDYDGYVSGVINIVLKKENDTGLSGHFFTELPTSKSIVYSFPNYSIQYGYKKLNLYTSYNGEINFEDIDETYTRQIRRTGQAVNITSVEQVRQKNLSHKFHYGFDYHVSSQDVVSYYGSVNPYSYEQDGHVVMDVTGDRTRHWNTYREETDKNLNVFNSLYYKHLFKKQGSELVVDLRNSYLKANGSVSYFNEDETGPASILNAEKPEQVSTSLKIDYSNPLGENLMINTGAKLGVKSMQNKTATSFGYNEQVYAFYGTLHYKKPGYSVNLGVRAEYAATEIKNESDKTKLSVLPSMIFQYKVNDRHNLLFAYRQSVTRPNVFQLNPYVYIDNPYAVRKGNPMLEPEFRHRIYVAHSVRFDVSYVSYRLFYENLNNAINTLTFLNDTTALEAHLQNLGNIHQLGMQFQGALKFGPLTLSPSVRLYNQSATGNSLARGYNVENKNKWIFEAGLSSVLSIKYDFALSGTFQYSTVQYDIQENAFSDALYIISLDKTFKNNIKAGVMTALPFAGTFVYQGRETAAQNFTSNYQGNLKLPPIPLMFRISYQFKTGKEKPIIDREEEDIPKRIKPGL